MEIVFIQLLVCLVKLSSLWSCLTAAGAASLGYFPLPCYLAVIDRGQLASKHDRIRSARLLLTGRTVRSATAIAKNNSHS